MTDPVFAIAPIRADGPWVVSVHGRVYDVTADDREEAMRLAMAVDAARYRPPEDPRNNTPAMADAFQRVGLRGGAV